MMQTTRLTPSRAKQLKTRLAKWGFEKNVKEDSMVAIARARLNRKIYANKDSAFRVNKRPVDERNIDRFLKRKRISDEELLLMGTPINGRQSLKICWGRSADSSLAPSPAFSVYTPRPPSPGGESTISPIDEHTTVPLASSLNPDNLNRQDSVDGSNLHNTSGAEAATKPPRLS